MNLCEPFALISGWWQWRQLPWLITVGTIMIVCVAPCGHRGVTNVVEFIPIDFGVAVVTGQEQGISVNTAPCVVRDNHILCPLKKYTTTPVQCPVPPCNTV